ncbi:hypothetical protein [Pseudactinotalea suaedae]|uniref:hypothetical protein n=1 Tax=Pseudactinotalea suaedae TaxID=1524924 RepID=UPI0012E2BD5F|nr:hypothetical protein [Pseudactinotalea suaedae]
MRWDALFADLQAQWEAERRADDDAEIRELAEAEAAGTRFGDRLRARLGAPLTLRLVDSSDRVGVVKDAAPEWVLLAEGERRHLVPVAAIAMAWPLAGAAPAPGAIERGLGLGHVLRALAGEGQAVVVRSRGGDQTGLLVRVGADHVDVAAGLGILSVPWSALLSVSST